MWLRSWFACSTVDHLLGVDQVEETVLVPVLLVDFSELWVVLKDVFAVGKQDDALLGSDLKLGSDRGEHLTHRKWLRHYEPTRNQCVSKTQKGANYLGLEIVSRFLDCSDFSTIKATLVGYLSVASSAHFFRRAISKQASSNTLNHSHLQSAYFSLKHWAEMSSDCVCISEGSW